LPGGRQFTTHQAMNDGEFIIVKGKASPGIVVTLPDGRQLKTSQATQNGEPVIPNGKAAYLADKYRYKTADVKFDQAAVLPTGATQFSVTAPAGATYVLTTWAFDNGEMLGN